MAQRRSYSYADVGFSPFLERSIASNPNYANLSDIAIANPQTNINFDQQQVSGSMGDQFAIGQILVDGVNVRIDGQDKNGDAVWRLGNIGD